jgi:hypothetical protein
MLISKEQPEILLSILSIEQIQCYHHLESVRVAHFNAESQIEARELDSKLLEEKRNTVLANVWKYQESLKRY